MNAKPKTALIAGATGLVGFCLLQRLLADSRYDRVFSVVRRPVGITHPKLREFWIDFDRLDAELAGVEADDWFCTIGTTIKRAGTPEAFRSVDYGYPMTLAGRAKASGAKQFLMVTAMGSSVHSSFLYGRVKGELERDLTDLRLDKLHLFRPSLLLGNRSEFRFGERVGAVVMKGINPMLVGRLRKYRGIQADAVAAGMIAAAFRDNAPGVNIYESDQIEDLASSVK
jgi:uncharacterized protein YbjT (DUF2867 family)